MDAKRRIEDLEERVEMLENQVYDLQHKGRRRQVKKEYISWDEAAYLVSKSKGAVQRMVKRERDNPQGFHLRRVWGAVHRRDFLNFLEALAQRNPGRGKVIRNALKHIEY